VVDIFLGKAAEKNNAFLPKAFNTICLAASASAEASGNCILLLLEHIVFLQ
jgi:hypothetical protein